LKRTRVIKNRDSNRKGISPLLMTSLEVFQSGIIFLHAQSYMYTATVCHQYPFILHLTDIWTETDRRTAGRSGWFLYSF